MKVSRLHRPGQVTSSAVPRPGAYLTLSSPADAYEQEAERMAARVMGGGFVDRRRAEPCTVATGRSGSPGRPLDPVTRAFMEPRFGHDFRHVRVHADERAAESAVAVEAAAYTVGHDIVFGAGQYAPETSRGRSLLAHELAHVVQQPPGLSRQPSPGVDKKKALAHHKQQQRLVVQFLKAALKLEPDPKDPLAAKNLYRNTAELIDKPKKGRPITLMVLTPTHYSTAARPVYFDSRVLHPKIGGDYPADPDPTNPKPSAPGLVTEKPETAGRVQFAAPPPPLSTIKKEEVTLERVSPSTKPTPKAPAPSPTPPPAPAPAAPFQWAWTQGNMRLFFNDLGTDITDEVLRNTFVHEGQHAVDLSERTFADPGKTDAEKVLAHYQSEFRAFWIQPVVPAKPPPEGASAIPGPAIENPPAPKGPAPSPQDVTQACPCPKDPNLPPDPKATPRTVTTALKNPRQHVIFWHLLTHYPHFKCFYACDSGFKTAVDDFAFPVGVNVVNSQRLLELNLELQNLEKTMKPADVAKTVFRRAVLDLDALDWAFLKDTTLSDAFWKDLDARAPQTLVDALKASATAGKLDRAALDKATVP